MSISTIDDKGRITIPQELRKKLGLRPGTKVVIAMVNNSLLIRRTITSAEFIDIATEISEQLQEHTSTPIKFEKLF